MIELTSRLTLSSCVSQLTEFGTQQVMPEFLDYGFQKTVITLCDESGEVLPFTIVLTPLIDHENHAKLVWLELVVKVNVGTSEHPNFENGLETTIYRLGMTHRNMILCAMHTAGDYIKFYTRA